MFKTSLKHTYFLLIVLIILSLGCNLNAKRKQLSKTDSLKKKAVKEWNKTIAGSFSDQTVMAFDSAQLTAFIEKYPAFKPNAGDISLFYSKRKFTYAWYNKGQLIEQAGNLYDRLTNLQNEGIFKAIPYPKPLDSLVFEAHPKDGKAKANINTRVSAAASISPGRLSRINSRSVSMIRTANRAIQSMTACSRASLEVWTSIRRM